MQIINVSIINVYCYSWCVVLSTNLPKGANTHTHFTSVSYQWRCANDALWFEPARHLNFRQHRHPRNYVGWQAVHSNERFYLPFIWRIENHYVVCATYLFQHARQHGKFVSATKSLAFNCFAIIHTARAFYRHISNKVSCDLVILLVHWSARISAYTDLPHTEMGKFILTSYNVTILFIIHSKCLKWITVASK